MRSKPTLLLLLLLVLPGLLLPAGTAWHRCGCAELRVERTSCCAHAARPAPVERTPARREAVRSCCQQDHDADRAPAPELRGDRCGCEWLPLADEQPTPTPPEPMSPPPSPSLAPATPFVLPPLRTAPANLLPNRGAATTRPPPPDHHRTLPLRL